jgi:hypothetical protein
VKTFIRLLTIIGFSAVTQAFAADPPASPPAATPSQPTRVVLEDKTLTNAQIAALFAQGYKPVERHGEVYYCRRESETGSRFQKMSCKSADQIKQLTRDSKDLLAEKQMPSGTRADQ